MGFCRCIEATKSVDFKYGDYSGRGAGANNHISPLQAQVFPLADCRKESHREAHHLACQKANIHVVTFLLGPRGEDPSAPLDSDSCLRLTAQSYWGKTMNCVNNPWNQWTWTRTVSPKGDLPLWLTPCFPPAEILNEESSYTVPELWTQGNHEGMIWVVLRHKFLIACHTDRKLPWVSDKESTGPGSHICALQHAQIWCAVPRDVGHSRWRSPQNCHWWSEVL